ncbi:lantibiotic dehydratase family protein [Tenacibaculum sp. MEBiC06402]|uniref:lantibiotic dehydratase family protein n=1 Tax=unclassified Tenacibaculum TaxID=2635139 RepID=UPI003B9AA6A5
MSRDNNPYQIFDEYYLRTPLFPISDYKKIIQKKSLSDNDFKIILSNKLMREAIYLASPNLFNQIEKWEKGLVISPNKIDKLKTSVLKYFTRISSRSTPFGLFAGCNLGKFGSETNIILENVNLFKRDTTLDFILLNEIYLSVSRDKTLYEKVLYYPNNSIYTVGNHFRYFEHNYRDFKREYSLEGLKFSNHLKKVLTKSKSGATISNLIDDIIDEDITYQEARGYIDELIKHQILISEVDLNVIGEEYLSKLLSIIGKDNRYNKLLDLNVRLENLDNSFQNEIEQYLSIEKLIKDIISPNNNSYTFKTNVFSSTFENTLDTKYKKEILRALKVLNRITLPSADQRLENFKIKFKKRYEDKKLSLSLVLDPDIGIGYGIENKIKSSFLNDIIFESDKKRYKEIIWSDFDNFLQTKLITCYSKNEYSIKLKEEDFENFPADWNDLPDTFSTIIELYKVGNESKIFMNYAGGSSAVNLLGRFSKGDKNVLKFIDKISKIEEEINGNKIIAEINHLPQVRTGNILQRSHFREFEIPILINSTLEVEKQIHIQDILVTVEDNRIKLFSARHDLEIVPKLGSAHLYNNPELLSAYRFLCDIQTQNNRESIVFNWNSIFTELTFLPRIEFDNFIFSKARWNFKTLLLKEVFESKDFEHSIKTWRNEFSLPKYVELIEGDRKLLVYLENQTSFKMLYHTVKNRESFILEEFLFSEEEFIKNNGKSFCNEVVISFFNQEKLNQNR